MNQWYLHTYEPILALANWQDFEDDVEKKIVGVYAWMPTTIMYLKMSGGRHRCDVISLRDVQAAMRSVSEPISRIAEVSLCEINFEEKRAELLEVVEPIVGVLGGVAASKYLHFSRPALFPMWDATIRSQAKLEDSASGYIKYMEIFQGELRVPENAAVALHNYPPNAVRGWDIEKMAQRNA